MREVDSLRRQLDHVHDLLHKLWMDRKSDDLTMEDVVQIKEELIKRRRRVEKKCQTK